ALPGPIFNPSALIKSAGPGIRAVNVGGSGVINIANFGVERLGGGVFSQNSAAISVQNLGSGSTTIGNLGTLRGNGGSGLFNPTFADLQNAVVSIDNTGVGAGNTPTNILNEGLIADNAGRADRLAIATLTQDGVVHILNAGTIVGRVFLTDGNDTFENGGRWSVSS